jgi:hypothetical protein
MKTGSMASPLHGGKAPAWLFGRMKLLAREILCAMREDHEADVVLRKLSDPYWFQCLGCVLGFDWHSSGVTTTVCGALKEGARGIERDLGLWVAGGKGRASRRTPEEIRTASDACGAPADTLVYNSRLSAKVDSAAVQDGYQIYHHAFFFTPGGSWAVVQQGMDETSRTARRYHWLGEGVEDFVNEPHAAIAADQRKQTVLNLVAEESSGCRTASAELSRSSPMQSEKLAYEAASLPRRHEVDPARDVDPRHLHRVLLATYEAQPRDFEQLLGVRGVGPKALRALSLLSELLHGEAPSFRDPARFSYAHGGKDGTPYPVDRPTYDATIDTLKRAVEASKIGNRARLDAIRRLARFYPI